MPAINPVRELFKRLSRERIPNGSIHERIEAFTNFRPSPSIAADLDPADAQSQAKTRLYTGANQQIMLSGTGALSAASLLHADGGCAIATGATDNDHCILSPRTALNSLEISDFNAINWTSSLEPHFETKIQFPAITNLTLQAGLKLTADLAIDADDDAAFFQFSTEGSTSTTKFTACTSIGDSDAEVVTDSSAVAAATEYRLLIRLTSLRKPLFFINGTLVYTGPTAMTSLTTLKPVMGHQMLADDGAKTVEYRWLRMSRLDP